MPLGTSRLGGWRQQEQQPMGPAMAAAAAQPGSCPCWHLHVQVSSCLSLIPWPAGLLGVNPCTCMCAPHTWGTTSRLFRSCTPPSPLLHVFANDISAAMSVALCACPAPPLLTHQPQAGCAMLRRRMAPTSCPTSPPHAAPRPSWAHW